MSSVYKKERRNKNRQQVMATAREPQDMEEDMVTDTESESEPDWSSWSSTGSDSLSDNDTEKISEKWGKGKMKKQSCKQPGSSSLCIPSKKRQAKESSQHLRHKESELLVTCGDKEGVLYVEKYNDSIGAVQKCIFSEGQWFKPTEFEKFGGKGKNKKWKHSICCDGVSLQKFIEDGYLSPIKKRRFQNEQCLSVAQEDSPESSPVSGRLRRRKVSQAKRPLFLSSSESDERGNNDEDEDEDGIDMSVFEGPTLPVTCGSESGILHKCRFATGRFGRCIRTENFWLSPEDFIRLNKPEGTWRKDIASHRMPLGKLIMRRVLELHTVNCDCEICQDLDQYLVKHNQSQLLSCQNISMKTKTHHISLTCELLSQQNDDVCFVCDSEEDLVCCDECPRAFHSQCHLPTVDGDSPGQWSCTFCVMKNMEDSSQKTQQDVLSSPVSQYTLHCQCLLLHLLHESMADPCINVPGYSENICGPMMLGRVKMNLENNDYQTVQDFLSDIEHVFHHSTSDRDNDFSRMTSRLKEIFKREFESIFKLQ